MKKQTLIKVLGFVCFVIIFEVINFLMSYTHWNDVLISVISAVISVWVTDTIFSKCGYPILNSDDD